MSNQSDWKTTKLSSSYRKALTATREIQPESEGFVVPSEAVKSNINAFEAIIKQNNTIIQLLVSIDQKVGEIQERVLQLERISGKTQVGSNFSDSIDELTKKLEGVTISGETSKDTSKRFTKNFRVYKDPQNCTIYVHCYCYKNR